MSREHENFAAASANLRKHYALCEECGDWKGCATGVKLWDQVALRFVEMVRSCASWHAKNHRGRARVDVLLGKMERAFRRVRD